MPAEPAKLLILSGAYVGSDLLAEFGRLPPSFLPLGARRLLASQLAFAEAHGARVWITLPEDYELGRFDQRILEEHGATVLRSPPQLSLRDALLGAFEALGEGRIIVLFGDTLVRYEGSCSEPDTFAVAATRHFAVWAEYTVGEDGVTRFSEGLPQAGRERDVVCGLFDFASGPEFLDALRAERTFVRALTAYAARRSLAPVPAARWLDFGHLHTYYQSRQADLAARAFNDLSANAWGVRKSGEPGRKIFAEAAWYRTLPPRLRVFTPQLLGSTTEATASYEVEYLYLSLLSELFCFGELPPEVWQLVLHSCLEFLELCRAERPRGYEVPARYERVFFDDMIRTKTHDRLRAFARAEQLDLKRSWTVDGRSALSLVALAERLVELVGETRPQDIAFWHGDFHFANIFFDFRARRIRCIDPRGMLSDGQVTHFGDARYDLAKLTHSVIGLYDHLVAGRFDLRQGDYSLHLDFELSPTVRQVQADFLKQRVGDQAVASASNLALTALLFLSMAPLHMEDRRRQYGMLANAFRLWRLAEDAV